MLFRRSLWCQAHTQKQQRAWQKAENTLTEWHILPGRLRRWLSSLDQKDSPFREEVHKINQKPCIFIPGFCSLLCLLNELFRSTLPFQYSYVLIPKCFASRWVFGKMIKMSLVGLPTSTPDSFFLPMHTLWEVADGGAHVTHIGDFNWVPYPWFCPYSALSAAGIWCVNQWMKPSFICQSQIFKN